MVINSTGGPGVPYDLTNITNAENILEFVREVNNISGEWFMTGMLLAGFIITFVAMRGTGSPREALLGSSFMIMIIAVFFMFLEFINIAKLVIIIIIFTLIFVISLYIKE